MTPTKKELTVLYDVLFARGVELLMKKYKNPCNLGAASCSHPEYNYCCSGGTCHLTTSKGCRAKCLGCKLWLCKWLKRKLPELEEELEVLRQIARFFYIGYVTNTKEATIKSATETHKKHPIEKNWLSDAARRLLSKLSDRDTCLSNLSRRVNELPRSQW